MKPAVLTSALFLTIIPLIKSFPEISSPDKTCSDDTTCTELKSCTYWQEKHKEFKQLRKLKKATPELLEEVRSAVCNKKEKGVCCPNEQENDKPTYLPDGDCGLTSAPPSRVFGGEETIPGEFPFLALLGVRTKWICAGTLINKWYVLTAAHCRGIKRVRLGAWKVAGFLDINDRSGLPPAQDFEVGTENFIAHPLYRRTIDNVQNDIALIRLPRKAEINDGVEMACLPLSEREVAKKLGLRNLESGLFKKRGTVVGWGYTCYEDGAQFCNESAYIPSKTQNKLQIPILPKDQCSGKLTGDQMCAGGEVGKDVCKGDSGGPLFYEEKDVSPWYLLGIVSFGSRICADGAPSVFTRMTSYVRWIRETIKE